MSGAEERNKLGATIEKYLAIPALLLGFTMDVLALLAVFSVWQEAPASKIVISPILQLTIWFCALIIYFGYLQSYWKQTAQSQGSALAATYRQFLTAVFVEFKYPYHLIPLVILFGLYILILVNSVWTTLIISLVAVMVVIAVTDNDTTAQQQRYERDQAEKDRIEREFGRWTSWIDKELAQAGYVTDVELSHNLLEPLTLCRKAIQAYYEKYRLEKDLALITYPVPEWEYRLEWPKVAWVLAKHALGNRRPWAAYGKFSHIKPVV